MSTLNNPNTTPMTPAEVAALMNDPCNLCASSLGDCEGDLDYDCLLRNTPGLLSRLLATLKAANERNAELTARVALYDEPALLPPDDRDKRIAELEAALNPPQDVNEILEQRRVCACGRDYEPAFGAQCPVCRCAKLTRLVAAFQAKFWALSTCPHLEDLARVADALIWKLNPVPAGTAYEAVNRYLDIARAQTPGAGGEEK